MAMSCFNKLGTSGGTYPQQCEQPFSTTTWLIHLDYLATSMNRTYFKNIWTSGWSESSMGERMLLTHAFSGKQFHLILLTLKIYFKASWVWSDWPKSIQAIPRQTLKLTLICLELCISESHNTCTSLIAPRPWSVLMGLHWVERNCWPISWGCNITNFTDDLPILEAFNPHHKHQHSLP